MKKASSISVTITTTFYMLCGVLGYAAFGSKAPGNFMTGFGFYDPYWLVDIGNIFIAVHLIGAYQVFCQPIYQAVENVCYKRWPDNGFVTNERIVEIPLFGEYPFSYLRLIWRTAYVIFSVVVAMIFPFFNDVVGLIGALAFWPLTVFLPIEMYIVQAKIRKHSVRWWSLKTVSFVCMVVSIVAAAGSIQGLVKSLRGYKPFKD